ncbi:MAG: response regulator transcription factor [Peptostreptococcaceae bacterium]|nr:response regulator transcription factor [Peptostreptococcaceae bacterium]
MKVLIVEDEFPIRSFISLNLKKEGYEVLEAEDGEVAIDVFHKNKDINIVLLDVMMPKLDGFEVLKVLRQERPDVGIIMLTARTSDQDKVMGLEYGADDYISKPFSPAELTARIKSLVRRLTTNLVKDKVIYSGIFKIDLGERKFFMEDKEIELTPKEFEILEIFLENKGISLSRDDILSAIWGKNYFGDLKVVDVNIRRIRKKIEKDPAKPIYLKTVWGYGYRWDESEQQ